MSSSTFRKSPAGPSEEGKNLEGIDRLFGRDLRSVGWVVDATPSEPQDNAMNGRKRGGVGAPDPAMIWALRGRRR